MKKDDFEDYWVPIQKKDLNDMILRLNNKYPNKVQYIEKMNTFLLKFTQP